jgi:hypothetical protein
VEPKTPPRAVARLADPVAGSVSKMAHTDERNDTEPGSWPSFAGRVVVCHVGTYLVAGLLFSQLFDYAELWTRPEMAHMRPLSSPWVAAGPGLQVVRGLVLAVVLSPFRGVFLGRPRGWLLLWGLLAGIGIVSPYGPSPGSVEGLIYTSTPLLSHLRGLPEVLVQSLVFSACLVAWSRQPRRLWTALFGTLAVLALASSAAGVLLSP